MDEYVRDLYTNLNNDTAYTSIDNIYKRIKSDGRYNVSRRKVRDILEGIDIYTRHVPYRKGKFRHVFAPKPGFSFAADVVYMTEYEKDLTLNKTSKNGKKTKGVKNRKYNKGFKYFLLLIDMFKKKVYVNPLKTTTSKEVGDSLIKLLKNEPNARQLSVDGGVEFRGNVPARLKRKKIKIWRTHNDKKSMIAERAILTIKRRLAKHLEHSNSFHWLGELNTVVDNYNNTYHRTIGMTPNEVNENNQFRIYRRMQKSRLKNAAHEKKFKFKLNNNVRLATWQYYYRKAYDGNFNPQLLTICGKRRVERINLYMVKNEQNKLIPGEYYEFELTRVRLKANQENFRISEFLDFKIENGQKWHYVSWIGYPKDDNSWVLDSDVKDL